MQPIDQRVDPANLHRLVWLELEPVRDDTEVDPDVAERLSGPQNDFDPVDDEPCPQPALSDTALNERGDDGLARASRCDQQ